METQTTATAATHTNGKIDTLTNNHPAKTKKLPPSCWHAVISTSTAEHKNLTAATKREILAKIKLLNEDEKLVNVYYGKLFKVQTNTSYTLG